MSPVYVKTAKDHAVLIDHAESIECAAPWKTSSHTWMTCWKSYPVIVGDKVGGYRGNHSN